MSREVCTTCAGSGETLSYVIGTSHVDCPMCRGTGFETFHRIKADWSKALRAALKAVSKFKRGKR